MKVLIFCPSPPYRSAESLVTLKLMKLLIDSGIHVDLIYQNTGDEAEVPDTLGILEFCHGVRGMGRGRLNILTWCWYAFRQGMRRHRTIHYDCIISRVMPIYGHLPAWLMHVFSRVKWLANWSDPYPTIIAPEPYGDGEKAKITLLQKLFCNVMIHSANWHTVPSERQMLLMTQYFPALTQKISVLPHVMLEHRTAEKTAVAEHAAMQIVHAGSVTMRHPEVMIYAVLQLVARTPSPPRIHINFIGVAPADFQQELAASTVTEYFTLSGEVNYDRAVQEIAQADLVLLLEARCQTGVFLSSKLLDYLQENKPVFAISPKQGVMADLIAAHGGGICADCNSPDDVAEKLAIIYQDWERNQLHSASYDTTDLQKQFSKNEILKKWQQLIQKLTDAQ